MKTVLPNVDLNQLPSPQLGSDKQFEVMSRSTDLLGRLQLFSKGNAINEGLIPPGTYGISESDEKIVKLGPSIDILPLARRLKALDMSGKEAIITNYDPTSDAFKDIAARSNEIDSGCMYGTSFLVFERTTGRFLEFYCGSKSTRPIAGDIAVFLPINQARIDAKKAAGFDTSKMQPQGPIPCTLKVRQAKNKRGHSWHIPDVRSCSIVFSNLPAVGVIADEMNRFTHPGAGEVEASKEEPGRKARVR